MAQVDFAERQLTLKLVYYGPALSGKTSNLRALHAKVDKLNRGRLMTLDTRDDRTLFFDLLPLTVRARDGDDVKTFTRRFMAPVSLSALNTSGSMSKNSVRSSFVSSVMRRPRLFSCTISCSAFRFVVFPLSAGP